MACLYNGKQFSYKLKLPTTTHKKTDESHKYNAVERNQTPNNMYCMNPFK